MLEPYRINPQIKSPKAKRKAKSSSISKSISAKTILEAELKRVIEFVCEHRFHKTRKWRLDYFIPSLKIGIELHGGVHSNGRHTRGAGFTEDREKMNEAMIAGILVLEVTTEQVKNGKAISMIKRAIETRRHELCKDK
ncbi:protein of unknown function DUF559 [Vibrio phage 1.205.O._10N.222.51.A7]|nr:protein of unknown function DUF559 [Vibrio phage 1.205.O._10N.222.51.A7]